MNKDKIIEFNNKLGIKTIFYNEDNNTLGYSDKDCIYINTYYDYDIWLVNKHELLHKFESSKEFNTVKEYIKNSNISLDYLYDEYELRYFNLYKNKKDIENEMIIDIISKNIETFPSIDEILENAFTHIVSKGKIDLKVGIKYLTLEIPKKIINQFNNVKDIWDKLFIYHYYYEKKNDLPNDKKNRESMIKEDIKNALNELLELKNKKNDFKIDPNSEEVIRKYESEIKALKTRGEDASHLENTKEEVCERIASELSNILYEEYSHIATLIENSNYPDSFKYLILNETLTNVYKNINVGNEIKTKKVERNIRTSINGHMVFNETTLEYIYKNIKLNGSFKSIYDESLKEYKNTVLDKYTINLPGVNTYNKGKWLKFNSKINDIGNHDVTIQNLKVVVKNTPWCTASLASEHLEQGDFYVFVDNEGKSHIAVKMTGDEIDEVRGILNDNKQELEPGYRDVALSFLENNKNIKNGKEWYEKEEWNKRLIGYLYNGIEDKKLFMEDILRKDYRNHGGNTNKENVLKKMSEGGFNSTLDKEFFLELVKQNGFALQYVPTNLPHYEEICLEAIKQYGLTLKYVPTDLPNYKDICLEAIKRNGYALQYVPTNLPHYEEICLEAIKQYGLALKYVPTNLPNYKDICLEAVKQYGLALQYVPEESRTEEICLIAIKQNGDALRYVPTNLPNYKDICLEAVKQDGPALQYVPIDLPNYKEICLEAVKQNGFALGYVPTNLPHYEEICLEAIEQNAHALQYVPEELKTEEMCLIAVKQYGLALQYVPEELRTEEMCLIAVKRYGYALQYVPTNLPNYKDICLVAVKRYGMALEYVPSELITEKICLEAVKQNGRALKYVPDKYKTKKVCLAAYENDADSTTYMPKELEVFVIKMHDGKDKLKNPILRLKEKITNLTKKNKR